jgi:hypothetical protein
MALINSNGRYIKLYKDGSYKVYSSEEARKRLKAATSGEIILEKYHELIKELEKPEQADFRYYDPEGYAAVYSPLVAEYREYEYNFMNYITGKDYPIMTEHYPDVADSIPEIIEAAYIPRDYKDVEEAYIINKQLKRFGETIDA